jgi:small subunit ribosomal protein S17
MSEAMDENKLNNMDNTEPEITETTDNNETVENVTVSETVEVDEKVSNVQEEVKKEPYKRVFTGRVKSNKADKTIIVAVERQIAHPLYKKYYKRTNSFMAHDPNNDCNIGDTVKIKECRPLSARKRWELVEVVERAK